MQNLAYFVRTHEKALANALQLQRQNPKNGQAVTSPTSPGDPASPPSSSSSSVWAAALSLPSLTFTSQSIKPAKLTLTPHHLFYILSRFEDLQIPVGPMNVRLENIHTDASPTNYVSFLGSAQRNKTKTSDRDSVHSVSSVRSVMSGMSSLWSSLRIGSNSEAKAEKQKAQLQEDLRYLYSAFTKIPCLRLSPDHKARLIAGYEEFPFDTAVPLFAFKNVTALEIHDVDFRQFYGWDRLAENLRSLTVKRAGVDDPADLLINIVLDDIDKRRRRSAKTHQPSATPWSTASPSKHTQMARSESPPLSPTATGKQSTSPRGAAAAARENPSRAGQRQRSTSPSRPQSSRHGSSHVYGRSTASAPNIRRSSGSSSSSVRSTTPRGSSSNLLSLGWFPATKWRFLRHLSLADNALTNISAASLAPLTNTLQSLDLSSNLFAEIPDSLASLTCLRALNLSNCMIDGLQSLGRFPLPAITTLNLRSNRLSSLAGVERLLSLERVDFRDNRLTDPTEVARLTGVPDISDIYVNRNPFCKTHATYRVTIFNLFRKTPGYTEDIVIDSVGPSSAEKKQLVDRVPETRGVPIVKPPPEDDTQSAYVPPRVVKAVDTPYDTSELLKRTGSLQRTKSGPSGQDSQRKKKGPKRRIVELSQNDSMQLSSQSSLTSLAYDDTAIGEAPKILKPTNKALATVTPRFEEPLSGQIPGDPTKKTKSEERDVVEETHTTHQLLPPIDTTTNNKSPEPQPAEFDVSSEDLYKKKIEALRQDFGNTWLSALGDESWDTTSVTSFPSDRGYSSPTIRPTMPRTPSQSIVSGRTLG
jgi:hypothetical protein